MENSRKLTYTKTDGERMPEQHIKKDLSTVDYHAAISPSPSLPSHYTKGDGILSYSLICVISGGTDRERDLLTELERKQTFRRVNVLFISSKTANYTKGGMTPTMMQHAFDSIYKEGIIHLRNRDVQLEMVDRVFMFTDVDHYYNELCQILSQKRKSDSPEWIISNPDIEIWIYYCFRNSPQTELKELLEVRDSERSSLLKQINGTFNNGGGLDPRKTFEHLSEGIEHAREHYSEDELGIPTLLSTQMYRFAKDILQSLGDEYDRWLQQRKSARMDKTKR